MADTENEERLRREQDMERLMAEQEQAAEQLQNQQQQDEDEHLEADEPPMIPLPPPTPPPAPSKLFSYRPLSLLSFLGLLYYALRSRKQYYLAVVFLTSSKWGYVVIGNFCLVCCISLFDLFVNGFLNGLRPHEAEGLQDFFRWNVTETCLALTMFRHELNVVTALQFVVLIVFKCLHHVAAQREQHLRLTEEAVHERFPYLKGSHTKLVTLLVLLQFLDLLALNYSIGDILKRGASVKILFAFEAAIMLVSAWSRILLWNMHVVDSFISVGHDHDVQLARRLLHPWKEYKATLIFAVELQAQTVQFVFYSVFFCIVLTYYGMPINLLREVYISFINLKERLTAFLKYRRLMASMNRFDTATNEELDDAGRTCIICRDEMTTSDCKRLPGCNHIFHKSCLREWLVQQQSCPTCRSDIAAMEARNNRFANRNVAPPENAPAAEQGEPEEARTNEEGEPPQETHLEAPTDATTVEEADRARRLPVVPQEENEVEATTAMETSTRSSKVGDGQGGGSLARRKKNMDHFQVERPYVMEAMKDTLILNDSLTEIVREVPKGKLVLMQGQHRIMENLFFTETPGGWLKVDDFQEVHAFQEGEWTP